MRDGSMSERVKVAAWILTKMLMLEEANRLLSDHLTAQFVKYVALPVVLNL